MTDLKTMVYSPARVPYTAFLLSAGVALKQCLPAQCFLPGSLALALSSKATPIRQFELAQRTRLRCTHSGSSGSRYRSSCRRRSLACLSQPSMSNASPSSSSGLPAGEASVGRAIVKGWMATLLCVASLLAGPDVLRIGDEVASATGMGILRPPSASALTDEQVGMRSLSITTLYPD